MNTEVAAATNIGSVRQRNEDCVVVGGWLSQSNDTIHVAAYEPSRPILLAILDGMGGHSGGDVASLIGGAQLASLDGIVERKSTTAAIEGLVEQANDAIVRVGDGSRHLAGMGATIAGIVLGQDRVDVFNVGDARVHRVVSDYLGQVSVDDRVVDGHSKGAVTQSLGRQRGRKFDPHHLVLEDIAGTTLLLSSDGLTDVVAADDIALMITQSAALPVDAVARGLVSLALAAGAPDNVSVIVVRIPAEA